MSNLSVMGPRCGKVKGWDWDMIAWIIAGIRVLILDTKNCVRTDKV